MNDNKITDSDTLLRHITDLSHRYGGDEYVKAGGGNTSVKDAKNLWVKPSGTTLKGMTPETFVQIEREKIEELYRAQKPSQASEREALVKKIMGDAVVGASQSRPSVEAPLHNVFSARYVVHTHAVLVNGLTCARDGALKSGELFPTALWVDYIDPGYTLCMEVRKAIQEYTAEKGVEPEILLMKNHGIFVAADTPARIDELYAEVESVLQNEYHKAKISTTLTTSSVAAPALSLIEKEAVAQAWGEEIHISSSPLFDLPDKALSPDHIVYMKSVPFRGVITRDALDAFATKEGYLPRIMMTSQGLYGVGTDISASERALKLAEDEALILQLSTAFGGVVCLSDEAIHFIDTWEVEAYRRKMAEEGV